MPGVQVHLRVTGGQQGAVQAVMEEQVAQLGATLLGAFQRAVAVRTGRTRDSIRMEVPRQLAGIWRLRFKARFPIRFLQKGAKAHLIDPRHTVGHGSPELRLTVGGNFIFAAEVHHPGMHKTHLVERALAAAIPGIAVKLKAGLSEAVVSELRAAAR